MLLNSDKSVISSGELSKHNIKKYEFKKLDTNQINEMKSKLDLQYDVKKERQNIAKSIIALDSTIENVKSQIATFESKLIIMALDIAKEVIIKEVSESSSSIAAAISAELLRNMSRNLNVIIKVNPLDFEFLNNLIKGRANIKIKSDETVAKGGVVIIGDNVNIDGDVMSRYQILKKSVLENFRE